MNTFYGQQKIILQGKISNEQNHPIKSASVIVKDTLDHILTYAYSGEFGKFYLQIQDPGNYKIIFSSLGYQRKIVKEKLIKEQNKINIILKPISYELKEVIISNKAPIAIKKDTIAFQTKYFTNGTEETVEDLLKKIPGLQIDKNGNIKVGNREIEKLMIDGDDFFGNGYKILSKNMPAHPIEEVDILKNYSNNKLLKNIEKSDKVALNLKLDERYKRIWFGDLEGSLGLDHYYEFKGNLMNFGKKNKFYFLGNINNIGTDATGDLNSFIYSGSKGFGHLGNSQKTVDFLNLAGGHTGLNKSRTNFNKDKLLSLNAIFNVNKQLKIKPLVFINQNNHQLYRNTIGVTDVDETHFVNKKNYELHNKNKIAFGKLDLIYHISETQNIKASTKYKNGDKNDESQLLFNESSSLEKLNTKNILFDQKINYTNRFNHKQALVITGRFIDDKSPQNYHINHYFYNGLFADSAAANNVNQSSSNHMQYAGIKAHYLYRTTNNNLLEFQLGNEYRNDNLQTRFSLFEDKHLLAQPIGYQNNTQYQTNDLYFNTKYGIVFNNFSIKAKMNFHQLFNRLKNNLNLNDRRQNPFFVNPSLGLNWTINKKNEINFSYSYNHTNAKILDVYQNYVLRGFRSFSKGTGQFNQLKNSNFILGYTLGNFIDHFFANFFVLYDLKHDFLSTYSHLRQNYIQSEKIYSKDRKSLNLNSNLNYYFDSLSSNLKLILRYSNGEYKNRVNDSDLRKVYFQDYSLGIEWRSSFAGFFNFYIGTKWLTHEIQTETNNSFTDNTSFLNLEFLPGKSFTLQINSIFYHFGNIVKHKNYYFLDFEMRYKLIKNKLTLGLSGKNLLNIQKFKRFSLNDISYSTTTYRLLPRWMLLKIKYRF